MNLSISRKTISKLLFLKRSLSSHAEIIPSIPSNLKLADPSILAPKPTINLPKFNYIFPRMNVPTSYPVVSFSNPSYVGVKNTVTLHPKIFSVAIRKDIILDLVRYHRLQSKQPNKTKRISEIRGSNKKPHPQKGSGRAQAGHRRNAIWRGGHKPHGPVIRDYSIRLNRKLRAQGMMIALAAKLLEKNLIVVDELQMKSIKTKDLASLLKQHQLQEPQCLFVDVNFQREFLLSAQNIANVHLLTQIQANVYEIVRREKLIITMNALEALQTRIMEQYLHAGKRKAYLRGMNVYRELVEKGRELGPQTGIPFQQQY